MTFNFDIYSSPKDKRSFDQFKTDFIKNGAIFDEGYDNKLSIPSGHLTFYKDFEPVDSCESFNRIAVVKLQWTPNLKQVKDVFEIISKSDLTVFVRRQEIALEIRCGNTLYFELYRVRFNL